MRVPIGRRAFLEASQALVVLGVGASQAAPAPPADDPKAWWPQQDPAVVQDVVAAAHGDFARVQSLVERQPALVNATVDWGFGDWEDALGGASHTGRRDIAEYLIARGARPTLFSAAMLGQLDVVRTIVAARPGVQRLPGPHGIPLVAHARAGGSEAAGVVQYLESLGGAGKLPATVPLDTAARASLVGRYRFGGGPTDCFDVDVENGRLGIVRPGKTRRGLFATGPLAFFPSGVPSVRIRFVLESGRIVGLTISDPDVYISARRE